MNATHKTVRDAIAQFGGEIQVSYRRNRAEFRQNLPNGAGFTLVLTADGNLNGFAASGASFDLINVWLCAVRAALPAVH